VLSIAVQGHKILRGGILEYFWLKKFLKTEKVDAVISDNRFGFFNRGVTSIFMTHQVQILMPIRFLQPFVNAVNHFFIRRFDALWIPDAEGAKNLAGSLAHGEYVEKLAKKIKINYLGTLSRMTHFPTAIKYRAIVVLSGPEPQRTLLEKKILYGLEEIFLTDKSPPQYPTDFCFVRGVAAPALGVKIKGQHRVELHGVLTTQDLNKKIMESAAVICRSGYSSLMDLVALRKRAILIPTPGQTEQEYLAAALVDKNCCVSAPQEAFNIKKLLSELSKTTGMAAFSQEDVTKNETLQQVVRELLKF
jgi:UDP-N-acetylglucosamine transferase subunit ALG13